MSVNLRLAALRLQGLHPTDRAWVLDRLPSPSRERLRTALGELALLERNSPGLDWDEALKQARNASDLQRMLAPPVDWCAALDALPIPWAALVLADTAEGLRLGYLERCNATRRAAIARCPPQTEAPESLRAYLRRQTRVADERAVGFLDAVRSAPSAAPNDERSVA